MILYPAGPTWPHIVERDVTSGVLAAQLSAGRLHRGFLHRPFGDRRGAVLVLLERNLDRYRAIGPGHDPHFDGLPAVEMPDEGLQSMTGTEGTTCAP